MTKSTKTMFDDYGDSSNEIRKLPLSDSDSSNALISHDTYVLVRKAYEESMKFDGNSDPFPLWQSLVIYFKDGELNPVPKEFEIQELTQIGWLQVTSVGVAAMHRAKNELSNENLYFFLEDGTQGYCKFANLIQGKDINWVLEDNTQGYCKLTGLAEMGWIQIKSIDSENLYLLWENNTKVHCKIY